MPRGSKPGSNNGGGRPKGRLNKSTIEKMLRAERELKEAEANKRPLAKDRLDELMQLFAGMAAFYQPTAPTAPRQNENGSVELFEKWAIHTMTCAIALAKYQSPTMRAIVVAPAPTPNAGGIRKTVFTLHVYDDDRSEMMQHIDHVPSSPPGT